MKNKKGVTLIELMIALAISGMLIAIITNIFISGNKRYSLIERELAERGEITRIAEKLKSNLVRNNKIISLRTNYIEIWSEDKNNDGIVQSDELITYSYSNGELKMVSNNITQVKKLSFFKLYPDCALPATNHIVLKIMSKIRDKSVFLDTSVCIKKTQKIKL